MVPPTAVELRRLSSISLPRGTQLYRGGHRDHELDALVPGLGDTRFAPLPGARHAYVSRSMTAALLESSLHHLSGPEPTLYRTELARAAVLPVRLRRPIRFIDLRDEQLERLGIARSSLVDTDPQHYPCTRVWARELQQRSVGGQATAGFLWHSRQADLHAEAHPDGLAADLLRHDAVEVAIIWSPPATADGLRRNGAAERLLDAHGEPVRLVSELASLLRTPIE